MTGERPHEQRMRAGEPYKASDPEVRADYERAQRLLRAVNSTPVEDKTARRPLLEQLLGSVAADADVLPPLQCDYGYNVHLGRSTFVNYGAVLIDTSEITLGDEVLLGPGVQLLTADHPLDPELRRAGWESGRPIVVTRDVPPGVVVAGSPARVLRTL